MKMQKMKALLALSIGLVSAGASAAPKYDITVGAKDEIAVIQPNMYGIFFEDINFGADGGLYGELIKNRTFDFPQPWVGWTAFGDVNIEKSNPCFDRNPNYLTLSLAKGSLTGSGIDNEGFKGIGFKQDNSYRLTFYARTDSKDSLDLNFEFINSKHENPCRAIVKVGGDQWKKYTAIITSNFTDAHSRLRIKLESLGSVSIDHVSLFPTDTWQGRENGMRKDLAQSLNDLRPGVFRFPGGCIIEGNSLETRYQWKNSVGQVENRPNNINRWFFTFKYKFFPDYYQTYGLGYFEYFQLCEDFGSDALPIISCGLACQYETKEEVPLCDLQPYIQDALDLIEFANGDVNTTWGKVRADMGHPAPFNLKMIGVGNEQWGPLYIERLELFVKAIRAKYPKIQIVGSSGPAPDGKDFDFLWPEMKRIGVDLVDEHYYRSPEWFFSNAGRYDNYDRKGPKVFAGEYASHHSSRENNFESALSEAAFMTGLERNADVVHLATYAPLFAHVDGWQWRPDLIWFDNLSAVRTPNYYVQQLYSLNKGTNALKTTCDKSDLKGQEKLYATSAIDKNKSEIIIKLVNAATEAKEVTINLKDVKGKLADFATASVLQSNDLSATNTFESPKKISPELTSYQVKNNSITLCAPKNSFQVIIVNIKK